MSTDAAMPARTLITISIPILNERDNLEALLARLDAVAKTEAGYDFEFLFTDNASEDDSFEYLTERAKDDPRIRVLRFSRNFGFQKSILCNYQNARGAAAIQIDADMQDPPEMISDFLRKWEEGYKVVYGIRKRRQESPVMHWSRKIYYALVTWLSQTDVPRDAGAALDLFKRARAAGRTEALSYIGEVYETDATLRDPVQAARYYVEALQAGDSWPARRGPGEWDPETARAMQNALAEVGVYQGPFDGEIGAPARDAMDNLLAQSRLGS